MEIENGNVEQPTPQTSNETQSTQKPLINKRGFAPIIFIPIILIVCGLIVGGAFYIKQNVFPSSKQAIENKQKVFEETQNLERDEIFTKLTKNSWGCGDIPRGAPGPDYQMYSFKADGAYSIAHITDYNTTPIGGRWNFEKGANGDWFLLYDNGQRLRFAFNGNKLILESAELEACKDILTVSNAYTADTLPKIQLTSQTNSTVDRLTVNKWKRANDFDTEYEPTSIELKKNWEYISTWRNGECQNSGTWSLSDKEIKGSSLTDKCDPRDDQYPESITAKLLDDGNLFLDYDLYVPENSVLNKGVIWSVFGYSDVVNIKVEYDMPIKAGVQNNFNVEMTNVGKEKYPGAITLQRFSVTEGYVRDYRQPNNVIAKVDEIAGIDLNSKVLQPGETYKFSVDVTFKKPGKQQMYINALMYGSTQSWDTHQVYSMNVQ